MNRITKIIAAATSFAVASVFFSLNANAGAVLDRVLTTKTLTVATSSNWANYSFLNDRHELDGYEIDITKGVAKHLGVEITFVTPSWDIITAGNWAARWDVAMGMMTPTKARAEKFAFPAVYAYVREVAVVHNDSKATKLSDLDGKVVGVGAATTDEMYAHHNLTPDWIDAKPIQYQFTPSEVKAYGTSDLGLADLRLGDGVRLDAFLFDEPTAREAVKAGYPIRILDGAMFSAPGAIAIEKGDKEFSDKIAAAIESMRDDGTLSKMSIKWFGIDYSRE